MRRYRRYASRPLALASAFFVVAAIVAVLAGDHRHALTVMLGAVVMTLLDDVVALRARVRRLEDRLDDVTDLTEPTDLTQPTDARRTDR